VLPWLLRIWRRLPHPLKQLYLRARYGGFAIGVAALIRDENGRILVVHRTYSRDEPWAMPGGWLERGDEAIESALERELQEETGLRVHIGPVCAVQRAGFALVLLMHADLVDSTDHFHPSPEVSEIAWIEPARVGQLSAMNALLLRQALA
jgi:ADP-ribose pyrophosphatase YjhB (NUDIX family)